MREPLAYLLDAGLDGEAWVRSHPNGYFVWTTQRPMIRPAFKHIVYNTLKKGYVEFDRPLSIFDPTVKLNTEFPKIKLHTTEKEETDMNENDRKELWNHAGTCLGCGKIAENYNELMLKGKNDLAEKYLEEIKKHMDKLDRIRENMTGERKPKSGKYPWKESRQFQIEIGKVVNQEAERRELWRHATTCPECWEIAENYNHLAMEGKADEGETYLQGIKEHMTEMETEKALDELHEKLTGLPRKKETPEVLSEEQTRSPFFESNVCIPLKDVEDLTKELTDAYRDALMFEDMFLKAQEQRDEAVRYFKALRTRFFEMDLDDFDTPEE